MPLVPRADQGLVPTAPTPGVRVPTEIPSTAFGVAEPPVDLSGVQRHVRAIIDDETQKAEQVAVSGADAAIVRAKTARLWDPKTGAMNARGIDAIPAADAAQTGFQKDAEAIEQGLTTDRQREVFRRRVDMHYADLGGQLGQHVAGQIKQHDLDVTNGHVAALEEASVKSYTDPASVERAIGDTRAVMSDYWRRNGHGDAAGGLDDFAKQHIADRVSAIRAGVFNQYSSAGQDLAAAAYFNAHKDDFTGRDREVAEKIAKAGSSRAMAQSETSRIIQAAPSLTDAMAEADKISEPTVQDDVKHRIRQHYADQASDLLHTRQQTYQQASKILEQSGGNMDAIPLALRTILLPGENEALQHRADQIRHPKDFGDSESFYHLKNLAHISDESRQQFAKENIATGYPNLSAAQRATLLTLQHEVHTQLARDAAKAAKAGTAGTAGAANVAATPVAQQKPYNPLAGVVTVGPAPRRTPTKAMLNDVATKGEGYATYLRGMGYNIPATASTPKAP